MDSSHKAQRELKAVTHQPPQLRPIPLLRSLQTRLRAAATTTHHRLRTISRLAHQVPPDTRRSSARQLALDSLDLKAELTLENLIQALKLRPLAVPIRELKAQVLARLTHQPDNPSDRLDQPQVNVHQPSERLQASAHPNKDRAAVDSLPETKEAEAAVDSHLVTKVAEAAAGDHRQASKTKARKATTRPSPENPTSTTRSTRKFPKLLSTATSRSSPATTPTLKPAVKCSTSAP